MPEGGRVSLTPLLNPTHVAIRSRFLVEFLVLQYFPVSSCVLFLSVLYFLLVSILEYIVQSKRPKLLSTFPSITAKMDDPAENLEASAEIDSSPAKTKEPAKKPVGDIATDVYAAAAECLDAVLKQRASVKSAIFSSPFPDKRFLMAITQKTMDNIQHIKRIVFNSQVLIKEPRLTKTMAYVVAFDMLFGEMRQPRGVARLMTRFTGEMKESLAKYMAEHNVKHVSELKPQSSKNSTYPRYIRVNTLKASVEEVIKSLTEEKFTLEEYDADAVSQHTFLKMLRHFKPTTFFRDYHVPDVLVFHPTVFFHGHELEKSGKIIQQDKASCLPALLLNPPAGSTVIDACAAPGMKTSHLAALMGNEGKIFAVDINEGRCKTLSSLLTHFGATCAEVVNMDFLKISADDEKYSDTTHILVDPTCTGSGVTTKIQHQNAKNTKKEKKGKKKSEEEKKRLQKLKGLQVTLLKHALSFPKVERVVYSTCSINPEEDEEVVQEAMKACAAQFVVRPCAKYLPKWKGSGKPRYSVGVNCLRSFPEKHRTNGFFVAVIERFTAADAEAAQNAIGEVGVVGEEGTEATKGTNGIGGTKGTEGTEEVVDGAKPTVATSGGGRKNRRRKRMRDEVSEHWSAGDAGDSKKQKQ